MTIVFQILLVLHFIGLASLLGGFLVQMKAFRTRKGTINAAMHHGALTQLVTGVLMVGVVEMADLWELDMVKISIKLIIAIVIYALVLVFRKKSHVSNAVLGSVGLLTIINIVVAVMWR